MKGKLLLVSVGLAAMLTGCNSENDIGIASGDGHMTSFRIELPGKQTRAQSDVYTPTRYVMEIFQGTTASGIPLQRKEQASCTFNVSLTYGNTYTCLFWADNGTPDNVANDEYEAADLKAVKIKADASPSNPAYGGMIQVEAGVSTPEAYSVTLKHAVAKVEYIQTKPLTAGNNTLKVVFPKTFRLNVADFSTTEIESTATTHTFENINKVETETTIATGYIIAPSDAADVQNLTVALNSEPAKTISNVPLQRNYKTSIKGAFSDLYEAGMTCSLTEEWDSPENEKELISLWDGTTTSQPTDYKADTPGEVMITSASELAWLAEQSNSTNRQEFADYTFTMTTDINLLGFAWPQIGVGGQGFKGVFDGKGHAIHGLNLQTTGTQSCAGLFYCVDEGGTVKNLTVRGTVNVEYNGSSGCSAGGVAGKTKKAIIENCHNACDIFGSGTSFWLGGIVGHATNTTFENCSNSGNIQVDGTASVCLGGITGTANNSSGQVIADNVNEGNIIARSSFHWVKAGGIIGDITTTGADVTLSGNENRGDIKSESSTSQDVGVVDAGGIIGYITTAMESSGKILVNNNGNTGTVVNGNDGNYAGGIIGQARGDANCEFTLTANNIQDGIPSDCVIGYNILYDGTITVDGNPIEEYFPYPKPQE